VDILEYYEQCPPLPHFAQRHITQQCLIAFSAEFPLLSLHRHLRLGHGWEFQ
jgi:hypothetical protein